jgi:hypothetical protein
MHDRQPRTGFAMASGENCVTCDVEQDEAKRLKVKIPGADNFDCDVTIEEIDEPAEPSEG